jgi:DNA-binding PucR family transcriptional regulator
VAEGRAVSYGELDAAASLAARRLAALDTLPSSTRARLLETLEAWLDTQGEVRPAAERLHVHVQTVRYRLRQLEELLGDALSDPSGRLELALALRVRRVRPA